MRRISEKKMKINIGNRRRKNKCTLVIVVCLIMIIKASKAILVIFGTLHIGIDFMYFCTKYLVAKVINRKAWVLCLPPFLHIRAALEARFKFIEWFVLGFGPKSLRG